MMLITSTPALDSVGPPARRGRVGGGAIELSIYLSRKMNGLFDQPVPLLRFEPRLRRSIEGIRPPITSYFPLVTAAFPLLQISTFTNDSYSYETILRLTHLPPMSAAAAVSSSRMATPRNVAMSEFHSDNRSQQ